MARTAYSVAAPACRLAAKEQMIGSAVLGNFGTRKASGELRILGYLFDCRCDEACIAPHHLWPEVFFCPCENSGNVVARLRGDEYIHRFTRPWWQLWIGPRLGFDG